jgi:hypothetical protein
MSKCRLSPDNQDCHSRERAASIILFIGTFSGPNFQSQEAGEWLARGSLGVVKRM